MKEIYYKKDLKLIVVLGVIFIVIFVVIRQFM